MCCWATAINDEQCGAFGSGITGAGKLAIRAGGGQGGEIMGQVCCRGTLDMEGEEGD